MCLCVCLSVCKSLYRLSQKVLDRFWWNLAGWCIMIKDRFLSKMGWIGPVERKPRPFQMLKSPYLTKFSGKFLKTLWNSSFYHLVDNFQTWEKLLWLNAYLNQSLWTKLADNLILTSGVMFLWYLFCYYSPFFIIWYGMVWFIEISIQQNKGKTWYQ